MHRIRILSFLSTCKVRANLKVFIKKDKEVFLHFKIN